MSTANAVDDWLPDDLVLMERSRHWAGLFKRYIELEDEKVSIELTDILSVEADDKESIPPEQFEDNACEDDPNFNVKDVLEQTLQVVAKRKEQWHQSGIDRLMDSFTVDMSNDKVYNWLHNNCYSDAASKFSPCKSDTALNGSTIKNQQYPLYSPSDDESLQSVDTAKYILSNRKIKQNKLMTIKEYCCSRRILKKISEADETYSEIYIPKKSKYYDRRYSDSRLKTLPGTSLAYLSHKRTHLIDSFARKSKYSRKLLKSPELGTYYHNHDPRRRTKVYRKRLQFKPDRYLSSSSLSEDESIPVRKFKRKTRSIKPIAAYHQPSIESVRSDTAFCPEKAAHSTAINITQNTINVNNNDKIPQETVQPQKITTVKDNCDILKTNKKHSEAITIYEPRTGSNNDPKVKISNGKVQITGEMLKKAIGPVFFKQFVQDKEFYHEFDSKSKVVFEPPEVASSTSESEPDILDIITKNWKGRIIEIVTEF